MDKELKYCRHAEDLEVNDSVKNKAKDYVKKYMSRYGAHYKKSREERNASTAAVASWLQASEEGLYDERPSP